MAQLLKQMGELEGGEAADGGGAAGGEGDAGSIFMQLEITVYLLLDHK